MRRKDPSKKFNEGEEMEVSHPKPKNLKPKVSSPNRGRGELKKERMPSKKYERKRRMQRLVWVWVLSRTKNPNSEGLRQLAEFENPQFWRGRKKSARLLKS